MSTFDAGTFNVPARTTAVFVAVEGSMTTVEEPRNLAEEVGLDESIVGEPLTDVMEMESEPESGNGLIPLLVGGGILALGAGGYALTRRRRTD